MSRNVCKWCGAEQQGEDDCGYQCASWRYRDKGIWIQSARCQQRCLEMRTEHEQTIEILKAREANTVEALRGHIEDLQRRIADAVAALTTIERHEAGSDLGFEKISDHGEWVLFEDLQAVRDIL